jgi:hypothetical protein
MLTTYSLNTLNLSYPMELILSMVPIQEVIGEV